MRVREALIAIVTGLLVVAATSALAGDFCFQANGRTLVALGFKTPGAGKCKAWKGGHTLAGEVVTGSGCTTSDGTTLRVGYELLDTTGPLAESGQLDLDLPGLASGTVSFITCTGTGCTPGSGAATGAPCVPSKQPVS